MRPEFTYLIWCGVLGLTCGIFKFPRWVQNLGWLGLTLVLAASIS